ncbi:MAG: single-stranded DNA-binding protein [Candidatus Daviesbacteria bacterium]|nr:single-stranded DNA-binding protein [Candidatus Daviesbacteria bacterium]
MASRSWNRIELIGNLTRDPELRFIPNGTAVASFGLATNRSYLSDGEWKEDVDFHKIVAWGKLADLCNQLLKKGAKVFISGRLQYREWQGQDGVKRRDAEIVLEDMVVITPKSGSSSSVSEHAEAVNKEVKPAEVESKVEENQPKTDRPSVDKKAVKEEAVDESVDIAADSDLPF